MRLEAAFQNHVVGLRIAADPFRLASLRLSARDDGLELDIMLSSKISILNPVIRCRLSGDSGHKSLSLGGSSLGGKTIAARFEPFPI